MQTITFYAYKGGTGRSLTLANAAKYLARLGQRVFVIDLDLEAPGLHHKLRLNSQESVPPITQGVVDCIHDFIAEGRMSQSLSRYTVEVRKEEERDGQITLMPAGNVIASEYWKRLAGLDWYEMFYKNESRGLLFFLELKERIRSEFQPDFVLIDARTGITEMGGVATTLLPDQVVCLMLNNRENFEGAREVIRGICRVSAEREKQIGIIPVLARVPLVLRRNSFEARVAENLLTYLNETDKDESERVQARFEDVLILHADEMLALQESLRIGDKTSVEDSPLLRDYLRLFARIIPHESVEPHLDRLVASATSDLLEKPDRVQSELESLATYCPHPTSYLALLKFYRLRNVASTKILHTAARYWELSRRLDPLLHDVVWEHYKPVRTPHQDSFLQVTEFVEAIWQAYGGNDAEVGLRLIDHLFTARNKDRAIRLIHQLLSVSSIPPLAIVGCITRLTDAEEYKQAQDLIKQWEGQLADIPEFQVAWASLVVRQRDIVGAKNLFESKEFRPAIILASKPQVYIQLLNLADRRDELEAALQSYLDQSIVAGDTDNMIQTAMIFEELGRSEVFRRRIKELLPAHRAERILEMVPRHSRHFR